MKRRQRVSTALYGIFLAAAVLVMGSSAVAEEAPSGEELATEAEEMISEAGEMTTEADGMTAETEETAVPEQETEALAEEFEPVDFAAMARELEEKLAEENESVSFQATLTQAAPGYQPVSAQEADQADGESGGESGEETGEPEGPSGDQFLSDLKNSYEARLTVIRRYAYFETMKEGSYNYYRFLCAEAERPFYDAYKGAEFTNKNYQFLCDYYLQGLASQYRAEALWREEGSAEEIEALYLEGYDRRAEVLAELAAFYLPDSAPEDLDQVTGTVRIAQIVETAVEKNKDASSDLVVQIQESLNELGYECGTADGQAGKNTVLAICHFQMLQGEAPDGLADQALADALRQALPEPETEAETGSESGE